MKITDLNDYLENKFLDSNATFKRITDDDYGSEPKCEITVPLNRILRLSLTEDEKKYILKYLKEKGVIVKGTIDNMNFESEDYEIIGLNHGKVPKRISSEETRKLFEEYNRTKNPNIREKIIIGNMRLVFNVLKGINRDYDYDYNDLVQAGYIGLINAVDKYDSNKGMFSTFACSYIKGYIIKEVYNEQGIKVQDAAIYKIIKEVETENREKIKDNPNLAHIVVERLIESKSLSKAFYNNYLKKVLFLSAQSLDEIVEKSDIDKEKIYTVGYEVKDSELNSIYEKELSSILDEEIKQLKEIKQKVLRIYYGFEGPACSLAETGKIAGMTKQGTSSTINHALEELKRKNKVRSLKGYSYKEV